MIPQVSLVAMTIGTVPSMDDDGEVMELSPGEFIAYAARVSNPSNQHNVETSERLLQYLQRAKHWSPFEMSDAILKVVTTRDIAHQILRHWSFRFQEFSQRYAEATKFHTDFRARRQDNKNRQNSIDDMDADTIEWWYQSQQGVADYASNIYKTALGRGIAKEMARKVLPEGLTETTIYMKGSVRSWMHYLAQRLDATTQKEHRDVAIACERELAANIPEVFGSHVVPTTND
jgi:thymidylate synthase (FAD)